jgi:hypothetical protein
LRIWNLTTIIKLWAPYKEGILVSSCWLLHAFEDFRNWRKEGNIKAYITFIKCMKFMSRWAIISFWRRIMLDGIEDFKSWFKEEKSIFNEVYKSSVQWTSLTRCVTISFSKRTQLS